MSLGTAFCVRVATAGATEIQNLAIMVKCNQNEGVTKNVRRALLITLSAAEPPHSLKPGYATGDHDRDGCCGSYKVYNYRCKHCACVVVWQNDEMLKLHK